MKLWVVIFRQRLEAGCTLLRAFLDSSDAYGMAQEYMKDHPADWVQDGDANIWVNEDDVIVEIQSVDSDIEQPL